MKKRKIRCDSREKTVTEFERVQRVIANAFFEERINPIQSVIPLILIATTTLCSIHEGEFEFEFEFEGYEGDKKNEKIAADLAKAAIGMLENYKLASQMKRG